MVRNPIQNVTDKLQYRAIGIVKGVYKPEDNNFLNKGKIIDANGDYIDAVVLGRALSLLKKYIKLEKSYFWIVYPRNKNKNNLHLQIAGIWEPYQLDIQQKETIKKEPDELLKEFKLKNNYFSIRGKLIYTNESKEEVVIKISQSESKKKSNNLPFKILIEGKLSIDLLNSFVSLNVLRQGETLKLETFEVIDN